MKERIMSGFVIYVKLELAIRYIRFIVKNVDMMYAQDALGNIWKSEKKKDVAERALHDEQLYRTIIDHRRQFINLKGFDYDTLYPATLSILPPEYIMDAWREDYEYMLLHMIYDNDAPTFEQLIEAIFELQNMIKSLTYHVV